jgi:hypothetical protein
MVKELRVCARKLFSWLNSFVSIYKYIQDLSMFYKEQAKHGQANEKLE